MKIKPATPAPTPIPAFAPVDREELDTEVALGAAVLVAFPIVVEPEVDVDEIGRSVVWYINWNSGALTLTLSTVTIDTDAETEAEATAVKGTVK